MLLQDSAIERIQANGDVVTIARLSASLQAEWLDCLAYFRARGEPVNMRPWDLNTISFQAWDDVPTIEKKMKGAVCKQIFRFAAHKAVAKASSPAASRYAVVRGSMAWRALAFFELCDTKPIILTAADAGELQQHGREFLSLYAYLREWSDSCGRAAYGLRPKLHYFAEMVEELSFSRENPRRQDLFNAESYLGKVKNVGRRVHRRQAPKRICHRLRIKMLSRWSKRR